MRKNDDRTLWHFGYQRKRHAVFGADSGEQKYYCFTFENGNKEMTRVLGVGGDAATVSFSVSWVRPVSAEPVGGEALVIGDIPMESVTELTETETAAG